MNIFIKNNCSMFKSWYLTLFTFVWIEKDIILYWTQVCLAKYFIWSQHSKKLAINIIKSLAAYSTIYLYLHKFYTSPSLTIKNSSVVCHYLYKLPIAHINTLQTYVEPRIKYSVFTHSPISDEILLNIT